MFRFFSRSSIIIFITLDIISARRNNIKGILLEYAFSLNIAAQILNTRVCVYPVYESFFWHDDAGADTQ